jgi:DNA-binding NarL/FixJ family response regulator
MPERAGLPVLMITSTTDSEVRRKAEALGARGFFEKPFSPARLRDAVNSIFNGI